MKFINIITGTPSTGKSTLAKSLCSNGEFIHVDIHEFYDSCGTPDKEGCIVIDINKLNEKISSLSEGNYIFDTHLSHLIKKEYISSAIILTCENIPTLKKRLISRGYKPSKVEENIGCELMGICLLETQELNLKNELTIDTSINNEKKTYDLAIDFLRNIYKKSFPSK